ncbi:MAG: hypothetical protein IT516_03545 [Burkholderiales bacterium]|nr:hypothetical protein [Burkholderiales bacterium]
MTNAYSTDDLLEFLDHAVNRGLMPAATAQALAVASRNVLGVLADAEKKDLSRIDIDAVIRRFNNKRAKDFNPASLKEYGRRVRRALELFGTWRQDPSSFTFKTRSNSSGSRRKPKDADKGGQEAEEFRDDSASARLAGTYQSSFPVRPGLVVTLQNIPNDLTATEADRLANFIRLLAIQ